MMWFTNLYYQIHLFSIVIFRFCYHLLLVVSEFSLTTPENYFVRVHLELLNEILREMAIGLILLLLYKIYLLFLLNQLQITKANSYCMYQSVNRSYSDLG